MSSQEDPRAFDLQPATDLELTWRHKHWWERRRKVLAAMRSGCVRPRVVERFQECGGDAIVEYSQAKQKHRVRANYCKSRHCEPCMASKANTIAGNIKRRLAEAPKGRYRFITLTLAHTIDTPLYDQVKRIYRHFRALRARPLWKKSQVGGVFTLECKWTAAGWHVHLHIIAEGGWIDVRKLSQAWHQVTGDSFVVDARQISSLKDAAAYVSKYVTKGTSPAIWDDIDLAQEWIIASKGTRVCATLGSWRGHQLMKPTDDANDWTKVGSLNQVIREARGGQAWAQAIVLSLRPGKREEQQLQELEPTHELPV